MGVRALRNLVTFLFVATASSAAYAAETATKPNTIADSGIPWTVVVAALACLLVRIVVFTESKNKLLAYNVAISGIAVLGSVVYAIEYSTGLAASFGVGLTMGAGAVSLVEFAKSKMLGTITGALIKALSAAQPSNADRAP